MKEYSVTLYGEAKPQKRPRTFKHKHSGKNVTWSPKEGHEGYINQLLSNRPEHPFIGAIEVEFIFYMERPKSVSVKKRPYPTVKPDLSNLEKFLEDAMNKTYYKDDSNIVSKISKKIYLPKNQVPKTEIIIRSL